MEIITWVLDGELEHKDSTGHKGIIYPGLAQRMSAGTGIWHSEMNPVPGPGRAPGAAGSAACVQMWDLPAAEGVGPSYEQRGIGAELDGGGLVPIASGRGHDAAV